MINYDSRINMRNISAFMILIVLFSSCATQKPEQVSMTKEEWNAKWDKIAKRQFYLCEVSSEEADALCKYLRGKGKLATNKGGNPYSIIHANSGSVDIAEELRDKKQFKIRRITYGMKEGLGPINLETYENGKSWDYYNVSYSMLCWIDKQTSDWCFAFIHIGDLSWPPSDAWSNFAGEISKATRFMGVDALKQGLSKLGSGGEFYVYKDYDDRMYIKHLKVKLQVPPRELLDEIAEYCKKIGVEFSRSSNI